LCWTTIPFFIYKWIIQTKEKGLVRKKPLLGDEIHKLKEMHKSGLNFSQIEKQMGICRQAISKYITGPNICFR
jgi:hypothetical protein